MQTKILTKNNIDVAARILKDGGLVAMPTETVYGLAANALNGDSVKKIFDAKGRPADNPLIVHISNMQMLFQLVTEVPEMALKLMDKFWPGPLTIILPSKSIIPKEVSAGLSTVAIRMPSHPIAIDLINKCELPLAAPSANLSGSPSPTSVEHVLADLDGKIDAVIDGGKCSVGLESTVITFTTVIPRILRPGGITKDQISQVIGKVDVDSAVLEGIGEDDKVESPGMKYKHYSPKAKLILLKGSSEAYVKYLNKLQSEEFEKSKKIDLHDNNLANSSDVCNKGKVPGIKKNMALCFDEDKQDFSLKKSKDTMSEAHFNFSSDFIREGECGTLKMKSISYGKKSDYKTQAFTLFDALRKLDSYCPDVIYAHCPEPIGIGMAVYNRLIRAAGFEVIEIE